MTQMSPDLIRTRWAHFVQRTLDAARVRGMTDRDIEKATGIMSSTFHRWRRGEVRTTPDITKVRAFCDGLGASMDEAMRVLGMTGQRLNPAPEPVIPPEVRTLLRKLADPNTSETDKLFIQESLRMLADRVDRTDHGRRPHRDEQAG